MNVVVRPEAPEDREAISPIHRLAFGQDVEARLVDALREGGFVRISCVAECDGRLIGHVLFSALPIVGAQGTVDSLSLAPVGVVPEHQGRGVGSQLIRAGLDQCRAQGHASVFVLGEPAYYRRFGFSWERAANIETPYPREAFMALELTPGALDGVSGCVQYPPPFAELE